MPRIARAALLAVALVLCQGVGAQTPHGARLAFDIPPQPLSDALAIFGRQAGLQVLLRETMTSGEQIATPAIHGQFSVEEVLERLLANTGLRYEFVDTRTVRVALAEGRNEDETTAASQSSSNTVKLEEIIVTATKRAASAQDIPMSISVITHQDIQRRGLIGMEDYLRSLPGVSQIDNGTRNNAVIIRGITTSPELENANSGTTVATYFDETPITGAAGLGAAGIDVRPVDMERIEILRGPQGTAYGSSSLSGTLRIIPAKPKLGVFAASLNAAYSETSRNGSGNTLFQGIVNIPIVADTFAIRAVGYRYDESGYYRNVAGLDPATLARATAAGLGSVVSGSVQNDVGQMVSEGGRLAALWKPTESLDLSINALSQTLEQDGRPVQSVGAYDYAVLPIAPQARVRGQSGEISDTEIDLLNLVINYDLGWGALTTAASRVDSGSALTVDVVTLPFAASISSPSDFESFTAETRLASKLEGRWQFLAGLFYEDVESSNPNFVYWPGTTASPTGTALMAFQEITRDLDQRAVFGEVSYDLTDKLTATAGGRFFKYTRDERTLLEGGLFRVPLGTGVPANITSDDDGSSFKASLQYDFTPNAMLYASWSEGFRLGRPAVGLTPGVCDVSPADGVVDGTSLTLESTRSIGSDFLENSELGGKLMLFGRRMMIDAAVFHIEWDGLPIRTQVACGNLLQGYIANVGAAKSDGVELQASLLLVDGLKIDFGGSYTRAELSKDAPGLLPPAFVGDRTPGSPEVSANLSAQYDFHMAGLNTFVRADSFYVGEFYADLIGTPATRAGDYVKLDARAGVMIKNASVELFVRNLTNEDALTWRQRASGTTFYGSRLRPRTIGIQVGYSFE
jgi:iron complex outermembrane recepter protein